MRVSLHGGRAQVCNARDQDGSRVPDARRVIYQFGVAHWLRGYDRSVGVHGLDEQVLVALIHLGHHCCL